MNLMEGVFNTDLSLTARGEGEGLIRGYYGSYELNAIISDSIFVGSFRIDSTLMDPVTLVNMDQGFKFSGLKDGASYPLDLDLALELEAFSLQSDIVSLGFFVNEDPIGGAAGSSLSMPYTPGLEVEGWNTVTLVAHDALGKRFSYIFDVHFGDIKPQIEVLEQPPGPILEGSTGNQIIFQVSSSYAAIDSVIVHYAGKQYIQTDDQGPFVYSLDGLPAADYIFSIEVTD